MLLTSSSMDGFSKGSKKQKVKLVLFVHTSIHSPMAHSAHSEVHKWKCQGCWAAEFVSERVGAGELRHDVGGKSSRAQEDS